jgi:hypothetical protein
MLKHRHPITTILFMLIAASACERLPLSLGQGIDALNDPRDSSQGTSAGGAGATNASAVGGASAFDECNTSYVLCLESGESPEICRRLGDCTTSGVPVGGASGGGTPALDGCNARYVTCLESGESPEVCRDNLDGCATSGVPVGGASGGGAAASDECNASYVRCLESGESPEVCREDLARCEQPGQAVGGSSASGDD